MGGLKVQKRKHNFALAGCFGPETAERLKKQARPIVLIFVVPHHQLQDKGRKLAKVDNQNFHFKWLAAIYKHDIQENIDGEASNWSENCIGSNLFLDHNYLVQCKNHYFACTS